MADRAKCLKNVTLCPGLPYQGSSFVVVLFLFYLFSLSLNSNTRDQITSLCWSFLNRNIKKIYFIKTVILKTVGRSKDHECFNKLPYNNY